VDIRLYIIFCCQNYHTNDRYKNYIYEIIENKNMSHQLHCQNTNSDTLRTDKCREILVTVWFEIFCVPLCCPQHDDYKHNKLEVQFLLCMGVRLCIILRVESRMRVFDNRVLTAIF